MIFFVIVMVAITLFLIAGTVVPHQGLPSALEMLQTSIYKNPFFILLLAVIAFGCLYYCFKKRPLIRQIGFISTHAGVSLALIGAFITYKYSLDSAGGRREYGTQYQLIIANPQLTQNPEMPSCFTLANFSGQQMPMAKPFTEFDIKLKKLEIDTYPVRKLNLYRKEKIVRMAGEFEQDKHIQVVELNESGGVDFTIKDSGEEFNIPASELKSPDPENPLKKQYIFGEKYTLQPMPAMPKEYRAILQIIDGDDSFDFILKVNKPLRYKGWAIYLMDYDKRNKSYITCATKKDAGRPIVFTGFWGIIIGISILSFRKQGGKK